MKSRPLYLSKIATDANYDFQPDSLYNFGMRPVMYSETEATQHKVGWVRAGQNIKYYKNNVRSYIYIFLTFDLFLLSIFINKSYLSELL